MGRSTRPFLLQARKPQWHANRMASRRSIKRIGISVALLLACLLAGLLIMRHLGRADIANGTTPVSLAIRSSSFSDGGRIPARLTCGGPSLSPQVAYSGEPAATQSLAIVMDDPDTPFGFVHWLVYNIPTETHALAEGASSQRKLPAGATEGKNSDDAEGYFAPCPPGTKPHRYVIRMYALDISPGLPPGLTKQQLASAVRGHILAEGQWMGLYGRSRN
jgi:Raf kinase inhibitor-like YbhB/YbcL family protein